MLRYYMRFLILTIFLLLLTPAFAAEKFSATQKQEIETVVREYLLKNPAVLRDAFYALEKQEKEQQQVSQKKALDDYNQLLTNSDKHGVIGNPNGDVTLVVFFDYNCGYCRAAEADMQRLISEDKNLRIALKEFPILGTSSMEAAQISAQLIKEPKYGEFHHALIGGKGAADKKRALEVAKSLGFDTDKLAKDMDSAAARAAIEESYKLANALNIDGTPAYVIGGEVLSGSAPYDALKTRIQDVREAQDATGKVKE